MPEEPAGGDTSGANKDLAFLGCVRCAFAFCRSCFVILTDLNGDCRPFFRTGTRSSGSPSRPMRSDRDRGAPLSICNKQSLRPCTGIRLRLALSFYRMYLWDIVTAHHSFKQEQEHQQQSHWHSLSLPSLQSLSRTPHCLSRPNLSSVCTAGLRHVVLWIPFRSNTYTNLLTQLLQLARVCVRLSSGPSPSPRILSVTQVLEHACHRNRVQTLKESRQ